jgi:D-3-phosphoglycerate dehydrogenase / 2-oxoglutarate reductase
MIAILDTGYEDYSQEESLFSENGYRLKIYNGSAHNLEEKIRFAAEADGILVRGTRIDRISIEKMPRLKVIVRYGTGYDNLDLKAATERGIRVANVQGYARDAVSDHALALMFSCIRNMTGTGGTSGDPHSVTEQIFGKPGRRDVFELHNKTLGIIGIGHIGSRFSGKASPLFERTMACDPYKEAPYMARFGAEKSSLEDLLEQSHVISLHCSLTEETIHLLDDNAFRRMRNRPVIVNTSRGSVLDERALLRALGEQRVHSAGLDVFEKEPHGEQQQLLVSHPRVVWTPHVAWYSDHSMRELQRRAAENMVALLTGGETADEIKHASII